MKAITTRYVGPGNVKGSAIIARTEGNPSLRLSYDNALNSAENHAAAVKALCARIGKGIGWEGKYVGATLPDGKIQVWVQVHPLADRVIVE